MQIATRRNFLFGSVPAAVLVATGGLGTSRKLFGQSNAPDPNIYNASLAAHAIATGNGFYVSANASDWTTVGITLTNVLNEWNANGRDAEVKVAAAQISPSQITSTALDQQSILQTMQLYQPQFQMADVQQILSIIDQNSAMVQGVLGTLQSNGFSYYINTALNQANLVAQNLSSTSSSTAVRLRQGNSATPFRQPPAEPPGGGGGGGYNCATDGALIFGAGLAFATLSVMTLGTVDVLAGAAWAGIALWGGLGTTGWGAAHVIAGCGF